MEPKRAAAQLSRPARGPGAQRQRQRQQRRALLVLFEKRVVALRPRMELLDARDVRERGVEARAASTYLPSIRYEKPA